MPRLTPASWQVLQCIFTEAGFSHWRTEGDHLVGSKAGALRPVVIPMYRDVDPAVMRGLMRTAGISREEYFRFRAKCK